MNTCGASLDAVGTLTAPIENKPAGVLSLVLIRNANGHFLDGMNLAKYILVNSFLPCD